MENISADSADNKDHPLKINIKETKELIKSYVKFIDTFLNIHTKFYMDLSEATSSFNEGCSFKGNIKNTPFFQMIISIKNMFEDYNKTINDIVDKDGILKFKASLNDLEENVKELDNVFFSGQNFNNLLSYQNLINNAHEDLENSIINKYIKDNYKREIKQEQKKEIKESIKNCGNVRNRIF